MIVNRKRETERKEEGEREREREGEEKRDATIDPSSKKSRLCVQYS